MSSEFTAGERATATRLYDAGRGMMDTGQLAAAENAFAESASSYPHYKTLELLGECRLLLGKPKQAIMPLAASSALNKSPRASILLARAFLAVGRLRQARYQAETALGRSPANRCAIAVMAEIKELEEQLGS